MKLMSRAERPSLTDGSMTEERVATATDLRPTDFRDYVHLGRVAKAVRRSRDHGLVSAEYWKSAPYFLTFADGYQLGRRLKEAPKTADLDRLLGDCQHISRPCTGAVRAGGTR